MIERSCNNCSFAVHYDCDGDIEFSCSKNLNNIFLERLENADTSVAKNCGGYLIGSPVKVDYSYEHYEIFSNDWSGYTDIPIVQKWLNSWTNVDHFERYGGDFYEFDENDGEDFEWK